MSARDLPAVLAIEGVGPAVVPEAFQLQRCVLSEEALLDSCQQKRPQAPAMETVVDHELVYAGARTHGVPGNRVIQRHDERAVDGLVDEPLDCSAPYERLDRGLPKKGRIAGTGRPQRKLDESLGIAGPSPPDVGVHRVHGHAPLSTGSGLVDALR